MRNVSAFATIAQTEEEVRQSAIELFEKGQYVEATPFT